MPLAKECEGMEVLISNYKGYSDMSVLRPYEARMYTIDKIDTACFYKGVYVLGGIIVFFKDNVHI